MTILNRFHMHSKTALITGGSQGLGAEMAKALASAGANVIVCSRNQQQIQAVASELETTYNVKALGLSCDVTDPDQVEATVARTIDTFGQVDVLINNAGINIRGQIEELTLDQFLQVQRTNVTGSIIIAVRLIGIVVGGAVVAGITNAVGLTPGIDFLGILLLRVVVFRTVVTPIRDVVAINVQLASWGKGPSNRLAAPGWPPGLVGIVARNRHDRAIR